MAEHDLKNRVLVDGFDPVSVTDIESLAAITCEQAEAMGALFRAIGRLSEDREIRELCAHGGLQADLQGNDIDVIRERAMKAGLAMAGAQL
jgi:hypothetical protein